MTTFVVAIQAKARSRYQLNIRKCELVNDGMKAVISGVGASFVTAALCAICFGVMGGDEAYNSWTVKASLATSVSITALVSVRVAQVMSNRNSGGPADKSDEIA